MLDAEPPKLVRLHAFIDCRLFHDVAVGGKVPVLVPHQGDVPAGGKVPRLRPPHGAPLWTGVVGPCWGLSPRHAERSSCASSAFSFASPPRLSASTFLLPPARRTPTDS